MHPPCLCRQQLEDVGWQPSKLELEAQLGASRERQAELEWRLGQLEGLLRRHAALLQGQAAPPLGSLLDAIDDGHVSPPKQVGCAAARGAGCGAAVRGCVVCLLGRFVGRGTAPGRRARQPTCPHLAQWGGDTLD